MRAVAPTLTRRGAAVLMALAAATASAAERPDAMQQLREAIGRLNRTFEADPGARVPAADLPAMMKNQIDGNGDGFVTRGEMKAFMDQMRNPDRSQFTMLNPDGFPLNSNPEIVKAADAGIGDDDIIMGVVLNGDARAYPVNYMNGPYNEIVNDRLGGSAIASTW